MIASEIRHSRASSYPSEAVDKTPVPHGSGTPVRFFVCDVLSMLFLSFRNPTDLLTL